jgi:hypothetical protein
MNFTRYKDNFKLCREVCPICGLRFDKVDLEHSDKNMLRVNCHGHPECTESTIAKRISLRLPAYSVAGELIHDPESWQFKPPKPL